MSMLTVMLASAAGLLLSSAPSQEAAEQLSQKTINYAHEQLLTEDGVERLRLEIARTARSVCANQGSLDAHFSRGTRDCVNRAYADGMEQLEIKLAQARGGFGAYAQASASDGETAS